jgi:hypothetical protein
MLSTYRYTRAGARELRISRVHARDPHLFCLLSDRNMVQVPLTIAPGLAVRLPGIRAGWRVLGDGKWVGWYAGDAHATIATERVSLAQILAHPDARMIILPIASQSVTQLGRGLLRPPLRYSDTDRVEVKTGV